MAGYPDSHDPHNTEVEAYMQGVTAEASTSTSEVRRWFWMVTTANDLKTCAL